MTLELFGHPFSSYTWKALIALYANNTPFEFMQMAGDRPLSEQFPGNVHPGGHIPVLVDDGAIVVEATSIVEHLAVHHPGPAPLIPADPAEAVVARMIDRVFDQYVMGNMQRVSPRISSAATNPSWAFAKSPTKRRSRPAKPGFGRPMPGSSPGFPRTRFHRMSRL